MDGRDLYAQHDSGTDRNDAHAENGDRDDEFEQSVSPLAPESTYGGVHQTLTCLKMPYIADTRAMATKPTRRPMTMMTAGSNSAVSFLIL